MHILTPYQIKRLCKRLFGTTATIAEHGYGYVLNDKVYFGFCDFWFLVTEDFQLQPVNLSTRHSVMESISIAVDNGLVAEVCDSFLEESTGSIEQDFKNALKEWDL